MNFKRILTAGSLILFLAISIVAKSQDYTYTDPDNEFSINFPGVPETGVQEVPTDLGNLDMYTVMYEASYDKVFMLAYTDYPADMVSESEAQVLLDGAKEGSMSSFGISSADIDKNITFDGYPGQYFEASGNDMYVSYKLLLVENRLYQIVILQMSTPISQSDISNFTDTFKLL